MYLGNFIELQELFCCVLTHMRSAYVKNKFVEIEGLA